MKTPMTDESRQARSALANATRNKATAEEIDQLRQAYEAESLIALVHYVSQRALALAMNLDEETGEEREGRGLRLQAPEQRSRLAWDVKTLEAAAETLSGQND